MWMQAWRARQECSAASTDSHTDSTGADDSAATRVIQKATTAASDVLHSVSDCAVVPVDLSVLNCQCVRPVGKWGQGVVFEVPGPALQPAFPGGTCDITGEPLYHLLADCCRSRRDNVAADCAPWSLHHDASPLTLALW